RGHHAGTEGELAMDRRWRSTAWKRANPRSASQAARSLARTPVDAGLRALRRVTVGRTPSYLDLATSFAASQSIEGDYCEFGVYTGRSFVHSYRAIRAAEGRWNQSPRRRLFAFDSFQGLPDPGPL